MVYLLSILVISRLTVGYLYGICASVFGVLLFNFFFTEPYFTFNATNPTYPVTFIVMLLVALMTSALTNGIKVQAKMAVMNERRTEILYELSKKLLITRGLENIVTVSYTHLDVYKRQGDQWSRHCCKGGNGELVWFCGTPCSYEPCPQCSPVHHQPEAERLWVYTKIHLRGFIDDAVFMGG